VPVAELYSPDLSKRRGNLVAAICKHSATVDEHPKLFEESRGITSRTGGIL